MKVIVNVPDLRIVERTDYKGNPVTCLEIAGQYVLFADGHHKPGDMDYWEDIFRHALGRFLAAELLKRIGNEGERGEPIWHLESPTGREVRYDPFPAGEDQEG